MTEAARSTTKAPVCAHPTTVCSYGPHKAESRRHDYILDRLRILGYLLVHTRQIDMAMTDRGAADALREKMLADIAAMLETPFVPPPTPPDGGAR